MRFLINPTAMADMFVEEGGFVRKEMHTKAELILTKAIRLCPVDTGRLAGSLAETGVIDGHDAEGPVCLIGSPVTYALWVEVGTRHMQAQPYLRPAVYGSVDAAPPLPWETGTASRLVR